MAGKLVTLLSRLFKDESTSAQELGEVEERLERSRNRYETERAVLERILESMPTALVVTDCSKDQLIQRVNPAFLELYNYSLDEIIGRPISILRPEQETDTKLMEKIYEQTLNGEEWKGRVINMDSNRDRIPIQLHTAPVYTNGNETPTSLLATMIDLRVIEERKALETLGIVAGGAIHDINNALTAVLGYASILQMTNPNSSNIKKIFKASEKVVKICSDVLSLKPGELRLEAKKVGKVIEDLITPPYRTEIINGYNLSIGYQNSNFWTAQINEISVQRLTDNLIRNAAIALSDAEYEGNIIVSSTDQQINKEITSYDGETLHLQGDYVVLEVNDNGPGMDEVTKGRIFEPFFTTRKRNQGTGLGLAIVKDIVKKHPGTYLSFESELGVGSTFTVYFPAIKPIKT